VTESAPPAAAVERHGGIAAHARDNPPMAAIDTPSSTFADAHPPSGLSVDASDAHELAFWSSVWNVTAEEVRQAVRWVGNDAASVGLYLGLHRGHGLHLPH
jgi:hypothetical protein